MCIVNLKGLYCPGCAIRVSFRSSDLEKLFRQGRTSRPWITDARQLRLFRRTIKVLEAVRVLADMRAYPGGCNRTERSGIVYYEVPLWPGTLLTLAADSSAGANDPASITGVEVLSMDVQNG